MNTTDKIVLDLFRSLIQKRLALDEMILFGYRARGDADDDTDMDVVNTMLSAKAQRLLVEENGKIIGVVREQDLFFQMVNVLSESKK
jgi:predicted nucleotidyltransferase